MMAAQSRQQKLLKNKIECLFTGRDDLCQLIGDYVDRVTKVGQSWMDDQANTELAFNNVKDFLETSLNFLSDVADKISVAGTSPSSPSVSQQSAARSTSPTFSMDASPSSSTVTREKVDKMEEQVDKTEEKVDKMEEKVDKMEEENAKRIQKLEERQKRMDEEKTAKTQEMEKRLSQLEGRVRMEKQTQSHEKTVSDLGMQMGGAVGGDRQQTESKQQIGFKVRLPIGQKVSIIKGITLACLTGHHYDAYTGVFTVPVSGKYKVTLTHRQERGGRKSGVIYLCVRHEGGNVGIKEEEESLVCETYTYGYSEMTKGQDSSEKVEQLGVGDRLWVVVENLWRSEKLVSPTYFSCEWLND